MTDSDINPPRYFTKHPKLYVIMDLLALVLFLPLFSLLCWVWFFPSSFKNHINDHVGNESYIFFAGAILSPFTTIWLSARTLNFLRTSSPGFNKWCALQAANGFRFKFKLTCLVFICLFLILSHFGVI